MTDFEALEQTGIDMLAVATDAVATAANRAARTLKRDLDCTCDNPADVVRTYAATMRDLYTTLDLIVDYPVKLLALANAFEED